MSTTALDILIRAKDEASRALNSVSGSVKQSAARAEHSSTSFNKFGESGRRAGEKISGALKGIAAGVGFVAIDELASKSLDAFDAVETGEKRLGYGLAKIGEGKKKLDGLVSWAKDFSVHTGIAEADVVGMQSKLTTMGGSFLKSLGPKADGTIKKITSGMVNLGSATGKSASLLLRSLGPALMNSPKTAITQLQKYGVLSDKQVAKLTALTKAGKNHAASMIEINALYGKFKGVAAASETGMDKLKNGINQLEIGLGSMINKGLTWLINTGWPAFKQGVQDAWQKAQPLIALLKSAASGILPALRQAWQQILPPLKKFLKAIEPIAKVLAIIIGLVVLGLLKSLPILIKIVASVIVTYLKLYTTLSNLVVGAFRAVVGAIGGVIDAGKKVVGWVHTGFNAMVSFIQGLPGRVTGAFSSIFGPLISAAKTAINMIKTVIGWVHKIPTPGSILSHIPGAGAVKNVIGHIPGLASGGIATRATLAVIGEAGPEAVVPLSRGKRYGLGGDSAGTLAVSLDRHHFVRAGDFDVKYRGY